MFLPGFVSSDIDGTERLMEQPPKMDGFGVISDLRAKYETRDQIKAAAIVSAIQCGSRRIRKLVTLALIRNWFAEDSNDFRREFTSLLDSLENPNPKPSAQA